MGKTAIYPGSFDPVTKGHLDVLAKASKMFGKVIIAVLKNDSKKGFLPTADRVALIQEAVKEMGLDNVEVDSFDGLTIEYAKKVGSDILIRGLRAVSDFEYEMQSTILFPPALSKKLQNTTEIFLNLFPKVW